MQMRCSRRKRRSKSDHEIIISYLYSAERIMVVCVSVCVFVCVCVCPLKKYDGPATYIFTFYVFTHFYSKNITQNIYVFTRCTFYVLRFTHTDMHT